MSEEINTCWTDTYEERLEKIKKLHPNGVITLGVQEIVKIEVNEEDISDII